MKVNDGQLDHANAENERIRKGIIAISQSHAKLFDLLKRVSECSSEAFGFGHYAVRIPIDLWKVIREETDESEAGT